MQHLCKKTQELEELEDKVYDTMFRAIFSSLDDNGCPRRSSCVPRDPPSPILEPAAGPWVPHSPCSGIKEATRETPKCSELVSLDQLLAELGPLPEESLSCDALVRELLENWDQEELPDREAAAERDSQAESALFPPAGRKEGCVLGDGSSVTPEVAAGSQVPHSTLGVTKDSTGEAETSTEMAPPDLLAGLCSGDSLSCDALVNKLLEKWEEEKFPERETAEERGQRVRERMAAPTARQRSTTSSF